MRNGLLAPFPNRVADGRYRFLGREHDLLPGRHGSRTVYHGFVREAPFELVDTTTGPGSARLRLRTTRIRPGAYPGYPFSIDVEVTYLISANEIDIEIRATNLGTGPAPTPRAGIPTSASRSRSTTWSCGSRRTRSSAPTTT